MTPAEARDALRGLLTAGGLSDSVGTPPAALIFGDGLDLDGSLRGGAIPARYRVEILAAAYDDTAALDALDAARTAAVSALVAAPGWALVSVSADRVVTWSGGQYYNVSMIVAALVAFA